MKKKNSINLPDVESDSLRGLGKLGYSESNKMHSTIKRLSSSLQEKEVKFISKKEKIKCPGCGRKFKSNNRKIPEHKKWDWLRGFEICSQKNPYASPEMIDIIDFTIINDYEVRKDDLIAFTTYPWKFSFQDWHDLKEHKIENIYKANNEKIYLKLEGIEEYIPTYIFVKNFIKL